MTTFFLLAQQDPADQWLEENPEVMGAVILVPALLNLLFGLAILVIPFMVLRKNRKLPSWALILIYGPGAFFCVVAIGMFLFAGYLLCGGSLPFAAVFT